MKIPAHFAYALPALLAFAVFAQPPNPSTAPAAGRALVLRDVRLFDGDRVVPSANVVVRDGRIVSAAPGADLPASAEIVDGRGKTLFPGLIDSHVHVWSADNLAQALEFGVTGVVDMFMNTDLLKSVKADQGSARPPLQAFLVSPAILSTVPGGHGSREPFGQKGDRLLGQGPGPSMRGRSLCPEPGVPAGGQDLRRDTGVERIYRDVR
jgi:hypothetical protein